MCTLFEEECKKIHAYKGAKETWDMLVVTYGGSNKIKRNKLNFLTRQYELFTVIDNENVQAMFSRFQTILNELKSLGKK